MAFCSEIGKLLAYPDPMVSIIHSGARSRTVPAMSTNAYDPAGDNQRRLSFSGFEESIKIKEEEEETPSKMPQSRKAVTFSINGAEDEIADVDEAEKAAEVKKKAKSKAKKAKARGKPAEAEAAKASPEVPLSVPPTEVAAPTAAAPAPHLTPRCVLLPLAPTRIAL